VWTAQETTKFNGGPLDSLGPDCQRTTAPTTSRISSKAMPGHPSANVEYRRLNRFLNRDCRPMVTKRRPPTGSPKSPFRVDGSRSFEQTCEPTTR
jgi:hypothetical protein